VPVGSLIPASISKTLQCGISLSRLATTDPIRHKSSFLPREHHNVAISNPSCTTIFRCSKKEIVALAIRQLFLIAKDMIQPKSCVVYVQLVVGERKCPSWCFGFPSGFQRITSAEVCDRLDQSARITTSTLSWGSSDDRALLWA
jgi:hypothetical protein